MSKTPNAQTPTRNYRRGIDNRHRTLRPKRPQKHMPDRRHIRVQLTLRAAPAGGRKLAFPAGEFQTVLVSAGRRHFSAAVIGYRLCARPQRRSGAALRRSATASS